MHMDKVTEAIAHFIGLFETTLEQARMRDAYQDFKADQTLETETPELLFEALPFKAPHEFVSFDPEVRHLPRDLELVPAFSGSPVTYTPLSVRIPDGLPFDLGQWRWPEMPSIQLDQFNSMSFTIAPPGSVAIYIHQQIRLSDDDYASIGEHGLDYRPTPDDGSRLEALVEKALDLSPFAPVETAGSNAEVIAFIADATKALEDYPDDPDAEAEVTVFKADFIEGIYVNGALVEETPDFETYRPPEEEPEEPASEAKDAVQFGGQSGEDPGSDDGLPEGGNVAIGTSVVGGTASIQASVTIEAGGNTLVNSVAITNNFLSSSVLAVVGDHVEINATIQINAWCDTDSIGATMAGWQPSVGDATLAMNIASLQRVDPTADDGDTASAAGDFPQNWAVVEFTGDLVIINWIEQFTYMLDNDIGIVSSSGFQTTAILGANDAANTVFLREIGSFYDLIIVGGNAYDANIIWQTNVLFDDDSIEAVGGFDGASGGSLSAGGNLLWNEADITNVGAADRFGDLPSHYLEAAEDLKDGDKDLSDDILRDSAFSGVEVLRVLYVSGDMINLQYAKQTNILGDRDQVALAVDALKANGDAAWTVTTGANTLVNFTGITDVDTIEKTYVGGEKYSDEILIQAEFVSSDPMLGARNPDALVSEAVAFLGDDMQDSQDSIDGPYGMPVPDAPHVDVMQTMLS